MGLTTTSKGWADTCEGLYLTGDDGGRWTDVTPPNLAHVSCVSEHIGTVRTLGTSDLWVSAIDVPWLNVGDCGGCVDPPGSALDSTTDGGTSWHSTGSCGALGCAFTEMNFVNPRQGIGSDGYVESTDDGGRTWTLVGYGPKNSLGPIELAPDGRMWEVIGDESTNPPQERIATLTGVGSCGCGRVPATEIGSSPVELGSVAPYGEPPTVAALPTFFGAKGVLLARLIDPTRPLDTLVIYTTADGGNRWTEHRGPVGADLDSFPDNGQFDVPFSAYGPTRWVLNVGRRTFETTDSGRHWSATASRGLRGALVWSASFVSATSGWSLAEERSCAAGVCTFVPHLYSTTDSGRRWLSISPP
jgi:hypothetical protein